MILGSKHHTKHSAWIFCVKGLNIWAFHLTLCLALLSYSCRLVVSPPSCPKSSGTSFSSLLLLTVVFYANMDAFNHRSQFSCTSGPRVRSMAVNVLWKCSARLEDRLYSRVVVLFLKLRKQLSTNCSTSRLGWTIWQSGLLRPLSWPGWSVLTSTVRS